MSITFNGIPGGKLGGNLHGPGRAQEYPTSEFSLKLPIMAYMKTRDHSELAGLARLPPNYDTKAPETRTGTKLASPFLHPNKYNSTHNVMFASTKYSVVQNSPTPLLCTYCMLYVLPLNVRAYCMSYLDIVLSCVASHPSYLCCIQVMG